MNCQKCNSNYDELDHIPKILIECGHTFCTYCIQQSLENSSNEGLFFISCYSCKVKTKVNNINSLPINKAIVDQKNQRETENNLCQLHLKVIEAYCETDKNLLCINCVIENHKNHSFTSLEKGFDKEKNYYLEEFSKIDYKESEITEKLKKVEILKTEYNVHLITAVNSIEQFYQKVRTAIDNREMQLKEIVKSNQNHIEKNFEETKSYLNLQLETYLNLKNDLEHSDSSKIDFLKSITKRSKSFQVLRERVNFNDELSNLCLFRKEEELNILKKILGTLLNIENEFDSKENGGKVEKTPSGKISIINKNSSNLSSRQPPTGFEIEINEFKMFDKEIKQLDKSSSKTKSFKNIIDNFLLKSKKKKNEIKRMIIDEQDNEMMSPIRKNESFLKTSFVFSENNENNNSYTYNNIGTYSIQKSFTNDFASLYKSYSYSILNIGGKLDSTTTKLDFETKTFKNLKKFQIDYCEFGVLVYKEKRVMILGGKENGKNMISDNIWLLNYDSLSLTLLDIKLKSPRTNFGCVYLNSTIYIIGGYNGKENTNSFEKYDKKLQNWIDLPKMISRRKDFSVTLSFNNVIYVLGGVDEKDNTLKTVERFNPELNSWSKMESMNHARKSFCCISMPDGVYVLGGENGNHCLKSVEKYEYTTKKWILLEDMIFPKAYFSCVYSNDYRFIYTCGGYDGKGLQVVERYDILQNKWEIFGKMNSPRYKHQSVLLNDN